MSQVTQAEVTRAVLNMMAEQVSLLQEIRDTLAQMNQANDPDPDAEPDPFQTLNGPSL